MLEHLCGCAGLITTETLRLNGSSGPYIRRLPCLS